VNASIPRDLKRQGNTATLIYDRLRTDILSGKLEPGAPLSQLMIAKANGTSRGPVREAMRRLQQDQLVIAFANRRFNVAPFDIADLEAVLSLHLANMSLAIRASVPLLTPSDIMFLEGCSARMEAAVDRDRDAWEEGYRQFALTIVRPSGARTMALVSGLIDNIQRYRTNMLDKFPRVYAGGPEFTEIMRSVVARDGDGASAHYAEFFGRISSLILAGASPSYDAAMLRAYLAALGLRQ
jgi:DNA-binding GntR family transcriptional regulator